VRSCLGSFFAKRVQISRAPEVDAHWSVVFGKLDENGAYPTLCSSAYFAKNFIPYSGLPGMQIRFLHPVYRLPTLYKMETLQDSLHYQRKKKETIFFKYRVSLMKFRELQVSCLRRFFLENVCVIRTAFPNLSRSKIWPLQKDRAVTSTLDYCVRWFLSDRMV